MLRRGRVGGLRQVLDVGRGEPERVRQHVFRVAAFAPPQLRLERLQLPLDLAERGDAAAAILLQQAREEARGRRRQAAFESVRPDRLAAEY